jgi:hypothetical protein
MASLRYRSERVSGGFLEAVWPICTNEEEGRHEKVSVVGSGCILAGAEVPPSAGALKGDLPEMPAAHDPNGSRLYLPLAVAYVFCEDHHERRNNRRLC